MDPSSIAAACVAAQSSQFQTAIAAKMLKMNANMASSAAQLLDAASQNLNRLANVAAGIGGNLDVTA